MVSIRINGLAAAALCLTTGAGMAQQDAPFQPEGTTAIAERQVVRSREAMIVTAHPLATEAGLEILRAGGSAGDAAVAVQLVLSMVEPQSSGLGGGGFLLYWDAALGALTAYDARETAPMAADGDYWLDDQGEPLPFWDAVIGGRSVGVPGTPMLLERVHAHHGRLPWADLFTDAIRIADDGFEVSQRMAASVAGGRDLDRFPTARDYFFDEDGAPLAEGSLLQNPDFARTLRLFADQGAAPFYTGSIARDIVAAVQTDVNPGMLSMADFAAYDVIERRPVCVDYRGRDVCGMGPPSSGALTVGQMLGVLNAFDLPEMGPGVDATHLYLEAGRLAFADRDLYMADEDFLDRRDGELASALLDRDYLADRATLIDARATMGVAEAGVPPWDDAVLLAPDEQRPRAGTTHFVIVDSYGDMISATTTIESGFGSRLMSNGFLLNNELTDFSFRPDINGVPVANRVEGGKRPRSSMAPTVVMEDGLPVLLIGSPGGANIIPYVAGALVAILDWEMDLQAAVDRVHVLNRNGPTFVEASADAAELVEALEALGHEVRVTDINSGLHAIRIMDTGLVGAADKRREGVAAGL